MQRFSTTSRFAVSASAIALGAFWASPVLAQTTDQQQAAQQQNTAVDCAKVTDPQAHATCIKTQGENAPAVAGAPESGTIIVTGSRIPKPNYDTIQPALVLNSQAIEQRGFVNAADALNELPQFGIPGSSPVGDAQGGAFGTGQSFVNFLGLGSQRTLVLVNGRRFISSNTASIFGAAAPGEQVDLAQINTKLIDRIETIAVGGAPIYGSDAIAGTINVILKHDYQGFDIDAENGISDYGDANNWRVRGLAGQNFADGRGNLTASAEYNSGKGFTFNDRPILSQGLFYDNCQPGSQYNQCIYSNGPRVNATLPGGVPLVGGDYFGLAFGASPQQLSQLGITQYLASLGIPNVTTFGVTNAAGNNLFFDNAGNLTPANYGTNPGGPNNFDLFAAGGNGFAYQRDTSQELSDTQRYNANLLGHFDFTDNIRLFGEAWYSHSKSTDLVSQPEYNSDIFGAAGSPSGSLILGVNNPFLTPDQRALILQSIANNPGSDQNLFGTPQNYFYLSRAGIDIPTGRSTYSDSLYRFVVGLNGKFNILAGQWNWEVSGNWGRSHAVGQTVDINTQNFFNAVGQVTADNPDGVPCLPGLANSPYPTMSSTCAAFNPFGVGRSSQAALDYILSPITNISNNRQFVFNAYVSGPIAKLPGGDLSLVAGVEHRNEGTASLPSLFYYGGDPNNPISYGQDVPIVPISGQFHTNEAFGELDGTIIGPSNNISFVHDLSFQTAARYVHNSISGGAVTWTAGGRYAPVRDISFRGNFTHAIRSPSLQEAFVPTSTFFGFAIDPCDADELGNGPAPATRQANCLAQGIPTTFASNAASASFLQSTGGNPNLKNEASNAFSIGGVITPRAIKGLNLSVDYINVKLKEAIEAFSATQVLDACYDSPSPSTNPFCALVTRNLAGTPATNPNYGQVTFVGTSFYNAAQLQYRGIVAALDYQFNTPFLGRGSSLDLSGSYQRLIELSTIANAGAAKEHDEGTLGYPKNSFTLTVNYLNGPLSLFTNFNYTGPVNQGIDEVANFRQDERIGSFLYINGGGSIEVNHRLRFFVDVDNIFNAKPPYPVPADGGAVTYFPGILGRYYRFGAGLHF
ncbi:MAG TPA: TonB-dependent receptor [Sphingomicrobium sp.]|jgi:outer membrane receptor protein involved in Fe transport|nr:TonB-dependent receptor [Sphingomicrobium sp.]